MKAGIVGLPNVGKSTLFNCLSSAKAQAANFPFCTIDAQMGQVSVPDERLTKLAELVHPGRIVPAVCDIVDIAGLTADIVGYKAYLISTIVDYNSLFIQYCGL